MSESKNPPQVNYGGVIGACWHCDMRYCICVDHPPRTPAMVPAPDLTLKASRRRTSWLTRLFWLTACVNLVGGLGNNWNLASGVFWTFTALINHHNEGKR